MAAEIPNEEVIMMSACIYASVLFPGMSDKVKLEYQKPPNGQYSEYSLVATSSGIVAINADDYLGTERSPIDCVRERISQVVIFENQNLTPRKCATVNAIIDGSEEPYTITIPLGPHNLPLVGGDLHDRTWASTYENVAQLYTTILYPNCWVEIDESPESELFYYCLTTGGVRFISQNAYEQEGVGSIREAGIEVISNTTQGPVMCRQVNLVIHDKGNVYNNAIAIMADENDQPLLQKDITNYQLKK